MGIKLGLTYDLKSDWALTDKDPKDANAEFDKPETIDQVIAALERVGYKVTRIGGVNNLLKTIDKLDVDIVFNLCEGMAGRNRESQVPLLLELKRVPYVGSDALTLGVTLDKIFAKKMFISEGIPTPRFFEASSIDNLEKINTIGFPLIVKTRYEGSSKGLSDKSRAYNIDDLKRQVKLVTGVYKQPALVEEFIRGTEFTVAVIGNDNPEAMPIIQTAIDGKLDLGDKIYTHNRIETTAVQYYCPAKISDNLTKKIQDIAVKAYKCVECRDFGRVDFRVDEKENPYVLEINPLPSLHQEDAFNIFPQVLGSTFEKTLDRIIKLALSRYGLDGKNKTLNNQHNKK